MKREDRIRKERASKRLAKARAMREPGWKSAYAKKQDVSRQIAMNPKAVERYRRMLAQAGIKTDGMGNPVETKQSAQPSAQLATVNALLAG